MLWKHALEGEAGKHHGEEGVALANGTPRETRGTSGEASGHIISWNLLFRSVGLSRGHHRDHGQL